MPLVVAFFTLGLLSWLFGPGEVVFIYISVPFVIGGIFGLAVWLLDKRTSARQHKAALNNPHSVMYGLTSTGMSTTAKVVLWGVLGAGVTLLLVALSGTS